MKTVTKAIACVCILSIVFMGCYTSAIIDPTGPDKEKMYSCSIQSVVTKDGKKHVFRTSPDIDSCVIVGEVIVGLELMRPSTEHASIPISNVTEISVSEFSTWRTMVLSSVGLILILVGLAGSAAPAGGVSL
jgi:hypothetical protein